MRRLQQWPRGYPGDFETVEYLCDGRSRAESGTIQDICETYSLTRSIAQQHRNKVQHQAARIMRTLLDKPGTARVFSIACGSCPDFRRIAAHLPSLLGELWLNDSASDAPTFSARALQHVHGRVHLRPGNAVKVVRKSAMNGLKFDLVLAGGLFDYLPDEHATYLIKHAWSLLEPGGVFFFTNIARGNPYRPLIEYFGDWFLIERSEDDVLRLCGSTSMRWSISAPRAGAPRLPTRSSAARSDRWWRWPWHGGCGTGSQPVRTWRVETAPHETVCDMARDMMLLLPTEDVCVCC